MAPPVPPRGLTRSALALALVVVAVGVVCIWFADPLLVRLVGTDVELGARWRTLGRLALVLVAVAVSFFLIRRQARALWEAAHAAASHQFDEAKWQVLFDDGPEAGFVLQDGRFILANRATGRLFGCPSQELIGLYPWEVSPPRQPGGRLSRDQALARISSVKVGEVVRFPWRHRQRDGTEFDTEVSLTSLPGEGGRVLAWVRDVTEERQTRVELASAHDQLRILVEGTPHFFFYVHDLAGKISYVSPSVEGITGHTVAEWLNQSHWFVTDSPINDAARTATNRHLKGEFDGKPTIVEIARPSGDKVVLEAYESGTYREGVLVGLQGIAQDVTARRRAEEALRESERALVTLLANLPGMAYRCRNDANWTMEFVSEGCRELTDYSPDELVGNRVTAYAALVHPDDREEGRRAVEEALAGGRPFQLTYRIRTARGEERWVWERGRGVFNDKGELLFLEGFIADISEQRRAEERSSFQSSLLGQVHNAVVATDRDGRISYWNRVAESAFGFLAEETLGKNLNDVLPPLARRSLFLRILATLRHSGHWEGELDVRHKDGRAIPLEVTGAALRDSRGEMVGFLGVASDISARRRAEKVRAAAFRVAQEAVAARSLEEFFPVIHQIVGELLPAANFYVALADSTGGVLRFPYYVDEYDEAPPPQPLGHGLTEYVLRTGTSLLVSPDVFTSLVEAGVVESVGSPSIDWVGVPLKTKDGTIGVLAVQSYTEGVRYSEEDRALLEFVSTQVAMAMEHVLAEQALRESEERYRRLVELSPDGIAVHSAGKLVFANEQALRLFGYDSLGEILGRPALEFVHPDFRDVAAERMRRVILSGEKLPPVEERFLRADGSWLDVEVTTTPYVFEGKPAGQVVVRDISERKRMESQLLQAQKQEAIGRLAGGIAHDFNNLLQAMLSNLQIFKLMSVDDTAHGKAVRELEGQVKLGAGLARQLLLFSRRELARPEVLDLSESVRAACGLVRRLVPENVRFKVTTPAEPLPVVADGGQVEQVVVNLLVNAVDAMPEGGELRVATGGNTDEVWLEVHDTGVGMSQAVRDKMFEPFFTTKGNDERTGLGLAVVHGIVARHGGRLEVESEPGQGSMFRVVLPRSTSARSEQPAPSRPVEGGLAAAGESILLVEDEAATREGLREVLTTLGYRVTAVADGEAALSVAAREHFDLLLTDLVLPGVHGGAIAEQLTRTIPNLRVVVMSGYTEDEAIRRGVRDGEVCYLQKPFDIETLARELRTALRRDGRA